VDDGGWFGSATVGSLATLLLDASERPFRAHVDILVGELRDDPLWTQVSKFGAIRLRQGLVFLGFSEPVRRGRVWAATLVIATMLLALPALHRAFGDANDATRFALSGASTNGLSDE
jgi:hypothetical protein